MLASNASGEPTVATSPASGPLMACSTSIASSTVRVIGPSLSSDQQSVIAPVRGTRPYVGRNPVERTAISGCRDLGVRLFRLRERGVARDRYDASQPAIVALNAIEVDQRQACGGELTRLDPAREVRDRSVGDVGVVGWQRPR